MRKSIIIFCLVLSSLIILDSLNAGHALFMFFLAGVIPGTNIAISAGNMLELFTLLIGFTLSRITITLIHHLETRHIEEAKPSRRRVRVSSARA